MELPAKVLRWRGKRLGYWLTCRFLIEAAAQVMVAGAVAHSRATLSGAGIAKGQRFHLLPLPASDLCHNQKLDLAPSVDLCYNMAEKTRPFCKAVEGQSVSD